MLFVHYAAICAICLLVYDPFSMLYDYDLTLIPTGVTIYGSHCFKAKFLKKLLNNINLKKIANP